MIKILHCGDLHLNSPFLSIPPEKAAALRDAQNQIVEYIAELCCREHIDILLMSGDVFDSENTFFNCVSHFRDIISSLDARVFISPGNHDFYSEKSHYASVSWGQNVHIFKSPVMQKVNVGEFSVYGAGFNSRWTEHGILSGFKADNPLSFGVLHGDLNNPSSRYNPITSAEIEKSGLLYLALGHVHERTDVAKAGGTYFSYCGCAFGRGFDEPGQKGGYIIHISDNLDVSACFHPFPARQYKIISVALDQCRDFDQINHKVCSALPPDSSDCIIRLALSGSPLCDFNPELLLNSLYDRCFHIDLKLNFSEKHDIWELCSDHSLAGLYMKKLYEIYLSAADESERESALLAAQYAYAAIKNIRIDQLGGVCL